MRLLAISFSRKLLSWSVNMCSLSMTSNMAFCEVFPLTNIRSSLFRQFSPSCLLLPYFQQYRQSCKVLPPFGSSNPLLSCLRSPLPLRSTLFLCLGAKSCPPIRVFTTGRWFFVSMSAYVLENLENGLEVAAKNFCENNVVMSDDKKTVRLRISLLFCWFPSSDTVGHIIDDIQLVWSWFHWEWQRSRSSSQVYCEVCPTQGRSSSIICSLHLIESLGISCLPTFNGRPMTGVWMAVIEHSETNRENVIQTLYHYSFGK